MHIQISRKSVFLTALLAVMVMFGSFSAVNAQTTVQFNNNLYWNMAPVSEEVKVLQQFLKDEGHYTGAITGKYLTQTYNAVVKFQNANNISPATGYFGPDTRVKANEILSKKTTTPNSVTTTQTNTTANNNVAAAVTTTTAVATTPTTASVAIAGNLILNPSMEEANGTRPNKWSIGKWGTNTSTFNYPVSGVDGVRGANVTVTSYSSGDSKWFFDDVKVVPGQSYTYSEYYKSNVTTNITIRWKKTDGSYSYQSFANPSASTSWKLQTNTFTVPAGVSSMTIFHLLKSVGTLDVDNYQLVSQGTSVSTPTPTPIPTPAPTPSPVTATVSAWSGWVAVSTWSTCSNSSQSRTEQRTRTVVTPASNGGTTPTLTELRTITQTCTLSTPTPTPTPSPTPAPTSNETRITAFMTSYTYWDNTPPGSANISHPIIHSKAGGTGTYTDPITLAVGHVITNGKSTLDYSAGTKFYVPNIRKYFIVEDTCGDGNTPQNGPCHSLVKAPSGAQAWLDMWIDGASVNNSTANKCAETLTGNFLAIQNPLPNYVVNVGSVISNGTCATQHGNTTVLK